MPPSLLTVGGRPTDCSFAVRIKKERRSSKAPPLFDVRIRLEELLLLGRVAVLAGHSEVVFVTLDAELGELIRIEPFERNKGTGRHAFMNDLVDELDTLDEALAASSEVAGVVLDVLDIKALQLGALYEAVVVAVGFLQVHIEELLVTVSIRDAFVVGQVTELDGKSSLGVEVLGAPEAGQAVYDTAIGRHEVHLNVTATGTGVDVGSNDGIMVAKIPNSSSLPTTTAHFFAASI